MRSIKPFQLISSILHTHDFTGCFSVCLGGTRLSGPLGGTRLSGSPFGGTRLSGPLRTQHLPRNTEQIGMVFAQNTPVVASHH